MWIVRKIFVRKHERALLFKNGDFVRFLLPGAHYELDPLKRVSVDLYNITVPLFEHRLADFLIREHAEEVARLFTVIETGADEVATVYENGRFAGLIGPERRVLYWKGIIDVTAEIVNIGETLEVPARIAKALVADAGKHRLRIDANAIYAREVPEAHVGVLYVNGELVTELRPGLHAFWKVNRAINVALFDKRVQTLEVGGQEILTKDKVGLRINLTANYQFEDAVKAVQAAKDPLDFLYKEIQFGLRAAVGTRTLDALLEDKGAVDHAVFGHVRDKFGAIGIAVRGIGVKDIILPGDMKDILGTLSVFGGLDGVLNELVRIRR